MVSQCFKQGFAQMFHYALQSEQGRCQIAMGKIAIDAPAQREHHIRCVTRRARQPECCRSQEGVAAFLCRLHRERTRHPRQGRDSGLSLCNVGSERFAAVQYGEQMR